MVKDLGRGLIMREGYGWKTEDGRLFMPRCFKCRKENWAPAVASGQCAWCGYEMRDKDLVGEED
jgi:hypothetical protein